jgi:hypothetical protein
MNTDPLEAVKLAGELTCHLKEISQTIFELLALNVKEEEERRRRASAGSKNL